MLLCYYGPIECNATWEISSLITSHCIQCTLPVSWQCVFCWTDVAKVDQVDRAGSVAASLSLKSSHFLGILPKVSLKLLFIKIDLIQSFVLKVRL